MSLRLISAMPGFTIDLGAIILFLVAHSSAEIAAIQRAPWAFALATLAMGACSWAVFHLLNAARIESLHEHVKALEERVRQLQEALYHRRRRRRS